MSFVFFVGARVFGVFKFLVGLNFASCQLILSPFRLALCIVWCLLFLTQDRSIINIVIN